MATIRKRKWSDDNDDQCIGNEERIIYEEEEQAEEKQEVAEVVDDEEDFGECINETDDEWEENFKELVLELMHIKIGEFINI